MRIWGICLLTALCGCTGRGPARIDPALAALVPSDTVVLAGVRLEALRATPLYRRLGSPAALFGGSGIDMEKATEILVVSNGRETALLARGEFGGRGGPAVSFVDPRTAVAGSPAAVRAILDGRGRSSGVPAALRAQVELVPRGDQIWAVGAGQAELVNLAPRTGNLANLAPALRLVESFRAGADLRDDVKIEATALCRREEDAESLAGALRVLTGLMRLDASVEARRALDGIRIEQKRSTVRIGILLSEETAAKVSGKESRPPHRP